MAQVAISYIRFSSKGQREGDSVRRQLDKVRAYCRRAGLELDETLSIHDLGLPAFRGQNVKNGALGQFMEACRRGLIPSGAALIVENIDRLSRQNLLNTSGILKELLDSGIEIHIIDLEDIVLTPGNVSDSHLNSVMAEANRARRESTAKSRWVTAAYSNKRKLVSAGGNVLIHGTVPWWCKRDGKKKPIAYPERAKLVKTIYEMSAAGMSSYKIASKFNRENAKFYSPGVPFPTYTRRPNWLSQRVRDVLLSDAVLGKIQSRVRNGSRSHDFVSDDYYPIIVSPELAQAARTIVRRNRKGAKGRLPQGHLPSNMFRGLLWHGHCAMRVSNARNGKKDAEGKKTVRSYYEAFDENGDKRRMLFHIPAKQLETLVLAGIRELTVEELLPPFVDTDAEFLSQAESECGILERQIDNLVTVAAQGAGESAALVNRIVKLEGQLKAARERVSRFSIQQADRQAAMRQVATTLEELKAVAVDGDNVVRDRICYALCRLVTRVYVGSPNTIYWDQAAHKLLHQQGQSRWSMVR